MSDCCIICLGEANDTDIKSELYPITNIHLLHKSCDCSYFLHKECLNEWLEKNPKCITCDSSMYYIERTPQEGVCEYVQDNSVDLRISLDNSDNSSDGDDSDSNYENNNEIEVEVEEIIVAPQKYFCCIIWLIFFSIVSLAYILTL